MELTPFQLESVKQLTSALARITRDMGGRIMELSIEATLDNGDQVRIGFGESGAPALLWVSR